jgi:hypothetical protein
LFPISEEFPLDFAIRGLWQFANKLNLFRIFMLAQFVFNENFDICRQDFVTLMPLLEYDKCLNHITPVAIWTAHDCTLLDRRVFLYRGFNLDGADGIACRDDNVVDPRDISQTTDPVQRLDNRAVRKCQENIKRTKTTYHYCGEPATETIEVFNPADELRGAQGIYSVIAACVEPYEAERSLGDTFHSPGYGKLSLSHYSITKTPKEAETCLPN